MTIGEKEGKFYLVPSKCIETVIEVLPFEFVQGHHITGNEEALPLKMVSDLERVYPELVGNIKRYRFII